VAAARTHRGGLAADHEGVHEQEAAGQNHTEEGRKQRAVQEAGHVHHVRAKLAGCLAPAVAAVEERCYLSAHVCMAQQPVVR
jgi:hypothetical protein